MRTNVLRWFIASHFTAHAHGIDAAACHPSYVEWGRRIPCAARRKRGPMMPQQDGIESRFTCLFVIRAALISSLSLTVDRSPIRVLRITAPLAAAVILTLVYAAMFTRQSRAWIA